MHKCLYCGRFARFFRNRLSSNMESSFVVISWLCKRCGYCEEES